jgi:hypothetical protein
VARPFWTAWGGAGKIIDIGLVALKLRPREMLEKTVNSSKKG